MSLDETMDTQVSPVEGDILDRKVEGKSIASRVAIFLIKFYRFAISPHLAGCCRFEPTCSTYGLQAFQKYGFVKAFKLTAKRLMRCRPGGPCGYDPVP